MDDNLTHDIQQAVRLLTAKEPPLVGISAEL